MYPQYWTPGIGGICIMKYSYEYKKQCVELYHLPWRKCCLSPILDMKTNEVISYNLSLSPNMERVKDMLHKAFKRFPDVKGPILHSD